MTKLIKANNSGRKETEGFGKYLAVRIVLLLSLIIFTADSLAEEGFNAIKAGDRVPVDFTCRVENGGIVMTTDKSLAKDRNELKADIFLPLKKYAPFIITAGNGKKGPDYGKLKTLENEILELLSLKLVGMKEKSRGNFKLESADLPGDLKEEERFLKLSKIRRQSKSIKIRPYIFKKNYGKDPVTGDTIVSENFDGLSMKVESVADDGVKINIIMKEGMKVDLPLGTGTVHDAGDHYETVLDVYIGKLIRSGAIVGRVVEIEGKMFKVDYGNPFGQETLSCDVTAGQIVNGE